MGPVHCSRPCCCWRRCRRSAWWFSLRPSPWVWEPRLRSPWRIKVDAWLRRPMSRPALHSTRRSVAAAKLHFARTPQLLGAACRQLRRVPASRTPHPPGLGSAQRQVEIARRAEHRREIAARQKTIDDQRTQAVHHAPVRLGARRRRRGTLLAARHAHQGIALHRERAAGGDDAFLPHLTHEPVIVLQGRDEMGAMCRFAKPSQLLHAEAGQIECRGGKRGLAGIEPIEALERPALAFVQAHEIAARFAIIVDFFERGIRPANPLVSVFHSRIADILRPVPVERLPESLHPDDVDGPKQKHDPDADRDATELDERCFEEAPTACLRIQVVHPLLACERGPGPIAFQRWPAAEIHVALIADRFQARQGLRSRTRRKTSPIVVMPRRRACSPSTRSYTMLRPRRSTMSSRRISPLRSKSSTCIFSPPATVGALPLRISRAPLRFTSLTIISGLTLAFKWSAMPRLSKVTYSSRQSPAAAGAGGLG